jgi:hypothetical protein
MASNSQDTLFNLFSSIFSGQGLNLGGVVQTLAGTSSPSSGSSGGIGSIASTILESALGVVPLIGGLLGLFGGGDSSSKPTFEKYQMPDSIAFQAASTSNGLAMGDYDQSGAPRAVLPSTQSTGSSQAAPSTTAQGAQITVTVQAMDSQSFLDRSSDIAAAVRQAMLNLNSINDVVNEL